MTILVGCSPKTSQEISEKATYSKKSKSIRLYKKAISKDSKNVEPYWRIGNHYYNSKDFTKAIGWFNKAITIDSAFNEGYLFGDRAQCKEELGDYYGAIEDYGIALSLCVDTFVTTPRENWCFYRARVELKIGDTISALIHTDSALYYWNSFPRARYQKARLLVIRGNYQDAIPYYEGLLDPSFADDKEFLEDVFYKGVLKFNIGDTSFCSYWKAAASNKYQKANEYILRYCTYK